MPVQPLGAVEQEVKGELELKLLIAPAADAGQVAVGGRRRDGQDVRVLLSELACHRLQYLRAEGGTTPSCCASRRMLTAAIPASSASATAACSTRSRFRRHNHGLAIGYAGLRTLEAAVIAVGIVSLLAVVTLRQQASADAASLVGVGRGLVAVHNWTFLLGPNFKGFRTTSSDQRETARISYQVVG